LRLAEAPSHHQTRAAMNALIPTHYVLIDYENIQPKNLLLLARESFHVAFFVGPNQETIRVEVLDLMQRLGNDRVKHIKVEDKGKNSLDFHLVYYLGRLIERNSEAHYYVISKDSGYDPLISHLGSRQIKAYRHDDINRIPPIKHASTAMLKTETPDIETRPALVTASVSNPADDLIIQLGGSSKSGKSPLLPLASANFLHAPKKPTASVAPKQANKPRAVVAPVKPQTSITTAQPVPSKTATAKTSAPPNKVALVQANFSAHKSNRPRTVKTLANHLRAMFQKEKLTDPNLQSLIDKLQSKGVVKVDGTKVSYPIK